MRLEGCCPLSSPPSSFHSSLVVVCCCFHPAEGYSGLLRRATSFRSKAANICVEHEKRKNESKDERMTRMRRSSSWECAQAECVTSSRFVLSHSRATALNSPSTNEIFKSCLSRSRRNEGRSFQFQLRKETITHSIRSPTRITYPLPTPRTIQSRASSCIGTMARE